jgi:hypothetical protein
VSNTTAWTATRTDRGLTPAHGGATLATTCLATKRINGVTPMSAFVGAPAYGADQESHPPREGMAG